MRALWIASMLPTRFNWLAGPWNVRSLVALRDYEGLEVRAVCPVGLTPPGALLRGLPAGWRELGRWFSVRRGMDGQGEVQGVPITYPRWAWGPKRLLWGWEGDLMHRQLRRHLARVVRDFRPDVIHSPWLNPDGVAATLTGAEHGVPVVAQGIGNDANYYLHEYPGAAHVAKRLRGASALMFNCESTRGMARRAGVDHPSVHVIFHGVEVDVFRPDPAVERRAGEIVTVAQLIPRKNHQLLLRAFGLLPPDLRDRASLTFVGGGAARSQLERLARQLGLQEKVTFAGRVPHADLVRHLQRADLYCLPTLSEGMPVATIEAMSCGLPVVASAVDGIPETVVEGETGLLVPPRDERALAAALTAALTRGWDREAIRRHVLDNFTWRIYARKVADLYRGLAA